MVVPGVLQFACAYMFLKIATNGFFYWLPKYLENYLHFSSTKAADFVTLFDVGSTVGNLTIGLCSDLLPVRSPLFQLAIVLGTCFCLGMSFSEPGISDGLLGFILFFSGFFITGASIVIAAIECDIGKGQLIKNNKRAQATISGFIDGCANFGSACG